MFRGKDPRFELKLCWLGKPIGAVLELPNHASALFEGRQRGSDHQVTKIGAREELRASAKLLYANVAVNCFIGEIMF